MKKREIIGTIEHNGFIYSKIRIPDLQYPCKGCSFKYRTSKACHNLCDGEENVILQITKRAIEKIIPEDRKEPAP